MFTASALFVTLSLLLPHPAHSDTTVPGLLPYMHEGLAALIELQPYVAVPERFADPQNRREIQKNLDVLASMKHAFPHKPASKVEPGFVVISSLFTEYMSDLARAYRRGDNRRELANQVRTATNLCMSCHTRMPNHVSFEELMSKDALAELTPYQKLSFFSATRQYEKALDEFDKVLALQTSANYGFAELPYAIHEALIISIRVRHDPALTQALLTKIGALPELPDFYSRYLDQWKIDAASWAKESFDPDKARVPALLSKARALVRLGEAEQYYSVDYVSDVVFLRATRYLHEALDREPDGSFRAEALSLLGRCYSALQDPSLWGMDKLYFEACIRDKPHTKLARECFGHYAGVLATASQRALTIFLDSDEVKKLKALKTLAK